MIKKFFIVIFATMIMVSCVSTSAVQLGDVGRRPLVPAWKVAVYRTADQVPCPYNEVALLVSTGDSLWTSESSMWKSMRKKAGKMGANAIILEATSEPNPGTKVLSFFLFGVGADRKGKAVAIFIDCEKKK